MPEQDDIVYFIDPDTMNHVAEVKKPIAIASKYFKPTTGMSYYDGILHYPKYHKANKGVKASIRMISPERYFIEAAKARRGNGALDEEYQGITPERVQRYVKRSKAGEKMPIPVIDRHYHTQEGRHRALVARELGLKTIPVLFVEGA